jgi:hypothetical protein
VKSTAAANLINILREAFPTICFFQKKLLVKLTPRVNFSNPLEQCCPTLSPFATCGDKRFECGDRQLLKNVFLMINKLHYLSNSDKSGDRKTFVATNVANVATERIWLETTALESAQMFLSSTVLVQRTKNYIPCSFAIHK